MDPVTRAMPRMRQSYLVSIKSAPEMTVEKRCAKRLKQEIPMEIMAYNLQAKLKHPKTEKDPRAIPQRSPLSRPKKLDGRADTAGFHVSGTTCFTDRNREPAKKASHVDGIEDIGTSRDFAKRGFRGSGRV